MIRLSPELYVFQVSNHMLFDQLVHCVELSTNIQYVLINGGGHLLFIYYQS